MGTAAHTIETLHRLVDLLPREQWGEAMDRLRELLDDPVLRALAEAPLDDEPETEEERAAVAEAKAGIALG